MTAEKHNLNYNVGNQKKLTAYDRAIRSQKVRKPKYFDDAVKYISSTQYEQEVKDALIKKLSSYPSNVIDKIFHNIDRMLIETEIKLGNQQKGIIEKVKKITEKPAVDLDALYESESEQEQESTAEVVDENPLVTAEEAQPSEDAKEEFVPDPQQDEF